MANRYPLIINSATNRIAELPAGDNLDLSNSNISNVANINLSGNLNSSITQIKITGGTTGQYISTDGLGNLTFVAASITVAQTVSNAAQPNITSTGTLTSLSVTGNIITGNISSGIANITTGNISNILFTKYSETVIAGADTGTTTLTPNAEAGSIYTYNVTGGITLNTLANSVAGTSMTIILTQGGVGSYTLTSTMKFAGGTKTLSTAVGAIDIISVFYDGTTYYASLTKGYA